MIRAIETQYKGYKFRSRLEARWAVFFDAVGFHWQYEPQGFSNGKLAYLPDFFVNELDMWLEVKPGTPTPQERAKLSMLYGEEMYLKSTDTSIGATFLIGPPIILDCGPLAVNWLTRLARDDPLALFMRDWRINASYCVAPAWFEPGQSYGVFARCTICGRVRVEDAMEHYAGDLFGPFSGTSAVFGYGCCHEHSESAFDPTLVSASKAAMEAFRWQRLVWRDR